MDLGIQNKVALVAAASSGLGKAVALQLSREGAKLAICARNETNLTKGNLSSHLAKLEEAGYVTIEKTFVGKVTRTICRLTPEGQKAFREYRKQMQAAIHG